LIYKFQSLISCYQRTQAGDPEEVSVIGSVFGLPRSPEQPLLIGSIKTNIWHLEAANGIALVAKAVYSQEKGLIPPNVWFEEINHGIDLEAWRLDILTTLRPWPKEELRRISNNR
jgi:acyl transferase domain-containing protein